VQLVASVQPLEDVKGPWSQRRVVGILASIAGLAALLWLLSGLLDALLLGFCGLLLAVFLQGAGAWLAARLRLPPAAGIATICVGVVALAAVTVTLAAPAVAKQLDELAQELPKAVDHATSFLQRYAWGRGLLERARDLQELATGRETLERAGGFLSTTLGVVAGFVVFLFVGLFVAFDSGLYRRGLLRLVPLDKRERVAEVLTETVHTLRMWLAGKMFAMFVVGLLTWLGLVLLGVPLALTLALFAAAVTFIPNFGPILSAIPAVLLGMLDGPMNALYVGLLYLGIQTVESYMLTPLVQKKTVSLPPALTLFAQVVMGTFAGGLGVVVATPLAAVALVLVKRLYVEDALGDREKVPPVDKAP
jgi:predicted PurR-regulated permease PerM